jgi:hypothetical protein
VAPLGSDPAVQAAVSTYLTDQIMTLIDPKSLFQEVLPEKGQILAVPLTNAVEGFISDQVSSFVASDRFAELWATATTEGHELAVKIVEGDSEVVSASGDDIELNFLPIINEALAQISQQSPEIFGRTVDIPQVTLEEGNPLLPEEARDRLEETLGVDLPEQFGILTIEGQGGALAAAQDAVRWFNWGVFLVVVLTLLLIPFTLWLSHRRRRTLLQMMVGMVIGVVLLRRLGWRIEEDVLELVRVDVNRGAVEAVLSSFLDPLFQATTYLLWLLVAVVAVAAVTGPYPWAVRLRREARQLAATGVRAAGTLGERAKEDTTVDWARANLTALQLAGAGVGIVLLLWLDLSWWGFFFLLLLVGAYELGVWWVATRGGSIPLPERGGPPPEGGAGETTPEDLAAT